MRRPNERRRKRALRRGGGQQCVARLSGVDRANGGRANFRKQKEEVNMMEYTES